MNSITGRLQSAVSQHIFPGAVVGFVGARGEKEIFAVGRFTYEENSPEVVSDTVYDVASLTKSIAGATALLKLIDDGELSLEDKVCAYVPEFGNFEDKKEVNIWHLLTYTLDLDLPSMSTLKSKSADEIAEIILHAPLKSPPGLKFQYVNSTAFFTHLIVEKVSGLTLDEFCRKHFFNSLGMTRTMWRPSEQERKDIVPTEIDPWRGRRVQGEVHDESTFVLQDKYQALGIAGLFSNASDILSFQEMLLGRGEKDGKKFFSPEIIELMHTDQFPSGPDHPSLGWKMKELSFMGSKVSSQAFAKTGFTGCLMITDPVKEKAAVFLSNWAYPRRPQSKEALNRVRRDIADIIFA